MYYRDLAKREWGSIIYLAAVSVIDQELYASASINGAGRLRQAWHVTIPGILPTIVILLNLRMGNMVSIGFEKICMYPFLHVVFVSFSKRGDSEKNAFIVIATIPIVCLYPFRQRYFIKGVMIGALKG